jgi:diguanylate cyclase (GGDEF)-like protein
VRGPQSLGSLKSAQLPKGTTIGPQLRVASGAARTAGRRRSRWAGSGAVILSALTLALVVAEYLASGSHSKLWLADAGWTCASAVAVIGVAGAVLRSCTRDRPGWLWLLGGSCAWFVGQLVWDAYGAGSVPASPNPADVCWLVCAVASAAGVYRLCAGASRAKGISLLEMTPLVVAVSALALALLDGDLKISQLSVAAQATAVAYPIVYVSATMVILQAVIASGLAWRRNPGVIVVLCGIALNAVAFILWAPQLLTGTYQAGATAVDALWSAGMILIGVGAWASEAALVLPDAESLGRLRSGVLPGLTFVGLAGVQIAFDANNGNADLALSVGLSIVGATLIVHGAILRHRQSALLAQLHARELELRDANRLLSRESRHDALTGLANRMCLREDLDELPARYCIVLIDLDRFKGYNDDQGHQAGDRVLARIGELLNANVREGENAYRYGGEELLIVMRGQHLEAGAALAERIRREVQDIAVAHPVNAPYGVVTLSAGVAAARPGETPQQVLSRADSALYKAKAQGRNRIAAADPAAEAHFPAAVLAQA